LGSCNLIGDFNDLNDTDEFTFTGSWVLRSGDLYIERHFSHEVTEYDHFADGDNSSLRVGGATYPIETLVRDHTTWTFFPNGTIIDEFWLNNDSIHPYALTQFDWNDVSVIEYPVGTTQLGGSARPITMLNWDGSIMKVITQETLASIDGWNVTYWSILRFEKVASW